jgi:hypothetical protein
MTEHTAPVATVINDNQPGRTAIIEVMTNPPTLPVGTMLYARPPVDLKRSEVFSFDDGLLTIKVSGHGCYNGWGTLAFPILRIHSGSLIETQRELYGCSRPSGGMSAIGAHHALLR